MPRGDTHFAPPRSGSGNGSKYHSAPSSSAPPRSAPRHQQQAHPHLKRSRDDEHPRSYDNNNSPSSAPRPRVESTAPRKQHNTAPPQPPRQQQQRPPLTPTTPVGRLLNELPPSMVPLERSIRGILYLLSDISCPNGPAGDGRQLTPWDTPPVVRQVLSRAKVITDVFCVVADRYEALCEVYGSGRTGLVSAYSSDVDCVLRSLSREELIKLEELGAREVPRHIRAQLQSGEHLPSSKTGGGDISDYGIHRLSVDALYLQDFVLTVQHLVAGSRKATEVDHVDGTIKADIPPVFIAGAAVSCSVDGNALAAALTSPNAHLQRPSSASIVAGAQETAQLLRSEAWRKRGISNLFGLSPFATEGPLHDAPELEDEEGSNSDEAWGAQTNGHDDDSSEMCPPSYSDDSDDEMAAGKKKVFTAGKATATTTTTVRRTELVDMRGLVGMTMSSKKRTVVAAPLIPANLLHGGVNHRQQKDEIQQLTRITRTLKPADVPSTWLVAFANHVNTFGHGFDDSNGVVAPSTASQNQPKLTFAVVNPVKKKLQSRNMRHAFGGIQNILHARVPIAKMVHNGENIPVDLGFCRDGASTSDYIIKKIATADSVWNEISKLTRELMFVNSCLDEEYLRGSRSIDRNRVAMIQRHRDNIELQLEQLSTHSNLLLSATRGLVIILKHLLHSHNLNDPSVGGLGSFPLTMMVLWFLEEIAPSLPRNLQGSYGALLVKFLGYFGDVTGQGDGFNARRWGLCVATRSMFPKPPTDELYIKNPLDGSQNAARACTRFFTSVQPLFHKWFKLLLPTAAPPTSPTSGHLEAQMYRSLSPLIQPASAPHHVAFPPLDASNRPATAHHPKCVLEIEKLFADVIRTSASAPPPSEFSTQGQHYHQSGDMGDSGGLAVYHAVMRRLMECEAGDRNRRAELADLSKVNLTAGTQMPLHPYEALAPALFDWLPYSQVFVMSGIGGLWL